MVLPQLDAYHAGRQLQHLQPWISVELAQQQTRGQQGTELAARYVYEAYAGFHVIQLLTEGAPICSSVIRLSLTRHRGTYAQLAIWVAWNLM